MLPCFLQIRNAFLRLLYRIALLYYFFLSFFQYIKDRYLMVNCQCFIVNYLSHDKPFNVLILSVSILIISITFLLFFKKKQPAGRFSCGEYRARTDDPSDVSECFSQLN